MSSTDPNPGPHAWVTGALPHAPSTQLSLCLSWCFSLSQLHSSHPWRGNCAWKSTLPGHIKEGGLWAHELPSSRPLVLTTIFIFLHKGDSHRPQFSCDQDLHTFVLTQGLCLSSSLFLHRIWKLLEEDLKWPHPLFLEMECQDHAKSVSLRFPIQSHWESNGLVQSLL